MRQDYQPYFNKLRMLLFEIGAVCIDEGELHAVFKMPSGWVLSLECERHYGPSWSIEVKLSIFESGYQLWILMKVFESLTGKSYGSPTLENQVSFIVEESDRVFGDVAFYSDKYSEINSIDG